MSAPAPTIADIIAANNGGGQTADMRDTIQEIESVKAVRFAWHPWMNLPNLGADSFRFNVPYAELPRLIPIALWTVPRPVIHSRSRGSLGMLGVSNYVGTGEINSETVGTMGRGFGDSSGFGGSVPSGSGARVTRVPQKPEESIKDLLQAWTHVGLTELSSLAAADEQELVLSYSLYDAVAGVAANEEELEAGRRPSDLLLEDFPRWLDRGAPRALEYALSKGVRSGDSRRRLSPSLSKNGERLITELYDGVLRAHALAIDPANGILPRTRKAMQTAKSGGLEGKTHMDAQDLWLMREFPSFPMDTEVDRAQRTLSGVMEEGSRAANVTNEGLMAIVEQNRQFMQVIAEGQRQTNELLAASLGGKRKKAEETGA